MFSHSITHFLIRCIIWSIFHDAGVHVFGSEVRGQGSKVLLGTLARPEQNTATSFQPGRKRCDETTRQQDMARQNNDEDTTVHKTRQDKTRREKKRRHKTRRQDKRRRDKTRQDEMKQDKTRQERQ